MGPTTSVANPSYRAVCSGTTGHVEVYDCVFDGNEETYEQLVRHFFMFHDPTTLNKQGNDAGTQYASVLYCYDQKQVRFLSIYVGFFTLYCTNLNHIQHLIQLLTCILSSSRFCLFISFLISHQPHRYYLSHLFILCHPCVFFTLFPL